MRKAFVLLLILISSFSVFAAERFYCLNATDNIGTGNSQYRFNYSTVFDLSDHFVGQSGIYPIYDDYASSSHPERQLNQQRAIGTVGVAECADQIKYTITALNNGQFISQSDPSKYREYYVVAVPDQGDGSSRYFYYPNNGSATSIALNTRTGNTMSMTTIVTGGKNASYSSMGIDLFLCMEELTDDDRLHLAPSDDYYATILVEWECANKNCKTKAAHSGSYSITVRGFFGNGNTSAYDEIFLLITPSPESNNMNLKELARTGNTQTISSFQINTVTRRREINPNNGSVTNTAFKWNKHIFAFLSASPDYGVSDSNGFLLKKVGTQTTTIPYKLTVYNTTGGARTNVSLEYDGKQNFTTGTTAEKNMCLNMDAYKKTYTDTFNGSYEAINYEGEIVLSLKDFEIPGSGLSFFDVMQNPTVDQAHQNYYTSYIGRYESNIYYHIVYSDTPLN